MKLEHLTIVIGEGNVTVAVRRVDRGVVGGGENIVERAAERGGVADRDDDVVLERGGACVDDKFLRVDAVERRQEQPDARNRVAVEYQIRNAVAGAVRAELRKNVVADRVEIDRQNFARVFVGELIGEERARRFDPAAQMQSAVRVNDTRQVARKSFSPERVIQRRQDFIANPRHQAAAALISVDVCDQSVGGIGAALDRRVDPILQSIERRSAQQILERHVDVENVGEDIAQILDGDIDVGALELRAVPFDARLDIGLEPVGVDDQIVAVKGDVLVDERLHARRNLIAVVIRKGDRTDVHGRQRRRIALINDRAVGVANNLRAVVAHSIDARRAGIAPQVADRNGIARAQTVRRRREIIARAVGVGGRAARYRQVAARREPAVVDVDRARHVGKHRALGNEVVVDVGIGGNGLSGVDRRHLAIVDQQIGADGRARRPTVAHDIRADGRKHRGIIDGKE